MALYHGPVIPVNGLILCLDAANPRSYPGSGSSWFDISGNNNHFTLFNSPAFGSGALTFNGTNQYAASTANINLTAFDSITVILGFRPTSSSVEAIIFEHTVNWNTVPGGLGMTVNGDGSGNVPNRFHTNHYSSIPGTYIRDYQFTQNTNWAVHANIWSRVNDSTGRLTYANSQQLGYVGGGSTNGTGTATSPGNFANAVVYLASRAGSLYFVPCQIGYLMIYNRKLSAAEVQQHFDAFRGRFAI
jgi:hypothetical protein